MEQLVRVFLLKELHGWEHESSLVEYLHQHPVLCDRLAFESIPDQSTLWRTWYRRFTTDLKGTIDTTARSILIHADRADVSVPREPPERSFPREQSLRLRENLAANEGARSFLYESNRDRTPLGHNHRSHLRDLSVSEIREMY